MQKGLKAEGLGDNLQACQTRGQEVPYLANREFDMLDLHSGIYYTSACSAGPLAFPLAPPSGCRVKAGCRQDSTADHAAKASLFVVLYIGAPHKL